MMISASRIHAAALGFSVAACIVLAGRAGWTLLTPTSLPVFSPVSFDASREPRPAREADGILKRLDEPVNVTVPARDLFKEWVAPPMIEVRLKLKSIEMRGPAVFYAGQMRDEDDSTFAQVNFQGRSYFLKEGEGVQGWRVLEIRDTYLSMENPKGETVKLPYRGGTVKNKDMYAVLLKEPSGKEFKVKEGESVEGFNLLEIGERSVRFAKEGSEYTVRQGDNGILIDRSESADERGNDESNEF